MRLAQLLENFFVLDLDELGAQLTGGHEEMWSHAVPVEGVNDRFHQAHMTLEASLNTTVGPLFLVGGVGQKREITRPRGEFALLRSDEPL